MALTAVGAAPGHVVRSVIYVASDDHAVLAAVWRRFTESVIAAAFTTASTLLGVTRLGFKRIHGRGTASSFSKGLAPDADFLHNGVAYIWWADDMAVFTFGRPLAEELEVGWHGPLPYRTAAGVGLKNTHADILRAYGKPTAASKSNGYARLIYDALGIAFRVQPSTGWVTTIAIFKPGSARQIWKF